MAQIGYIGQLRPPARKYTAQETTQVSSNPFPHSQNRRSSRSKEQVFQLTDKNQMRNIPAARGVAVERERLSTDRLACRSIERTNRSAMIVFVSNYYFFYPIPPPCKSSKVSIR